MRNVESLHVLDDYWHPEHAVRTEVGQLVHRAKDHGDDQAVVLLAERFAGLAGRFAAASAGSRSLVAAIPSGPVAAVNGRRPPIGSVLARALAAAGAGQYRPDLLARRRATPKLRDVDPDLRTAVVAELGYEVCEPVAGCHVVMVDDVILTGTTLGVVAACLREAGAASVTAVVAARTRRP